MVSTEAAFGLESVTGVDPVALSAAVQQRQILREQARQARQAAAQATDPAVAAYLDHVATVLQAGADGVNLDDLQQALDGFAQFAKQHPAFFPNQAVEFIGLVNNAITAIRQAVTAISNITDFDSAVAAAGATGDALYAVGVAYTLAGIASLVVGGPLGPFVLAGGVVIAGGLFKAFSVVIKDLFGPDPQSTSTTPSTQASPDSDGDPTDPDGDPDGDTDGDSEGAFTDTDTDPPTDPGNGTLTPVDGDGQSGFGTGAATGEEGGDAGGGSSGDEGAGQTQDASGPTDSFGNPEAQEQFTDDD